MPQRARAFVDFVLALGAWSVLWAATHPSFPDAAHYVGCLCVALVASGMKVRLPRTTGTFSLNFCFCLVCITHFSLCETVLLGLLSAWVQSVWNAAKPPEGVQILFSMATVAVSSALSYGSYQWLQERGGREFPLLALGAVVCLYFLINTGLVAGVLALLEKKPFFSTWDHLYLWTLPYYLLGSVLIGSIYRVIQTERWAASLLVLPILGFLFYYYRLIVTRQSRLASAINN